MPRESVVRCKQESEKFYNTGIQFEPLSELKACFSRGKVAEIIALGAKGKKANGPRPFCPSPTGFLHIGGARTALFNWMYAKPRAANLSCALKIRTRSVQSPNILKRSLTA
jgi:hypothetical protein